MYSLKCIVARFGERATQQEILERIAPVSQPRLATRAIATRMRAGAGWALPEAFFVYFSMQPHGCRRARMRELGISRSRPLFVPIRNANVARARRRARRYSLKLSMSTLKRVALRVGACAAPCSGAASAASAAAMMSLTGGVARARATCTSSFFTSLCQHMLSA